MMDSTGHPRRILLGNSGAIMAREKILCSPTESWIVPILSPQRTDAARPSPSFTTAFATMESNDNKEPLALSNPAKALLGSDCAK